MSQLASLDSQYLGFQEPHRSSKPYCSILEAISISQELTGRKMDYEYVDQNMVGDHMWWISDVRKFQSHYPDWSIEYDVRQICQEILKNNAERWCAEVAH